MYSFVNDMSNIMMQKKGRSRAINQENPTGEKGKGGMAASELGPSRKGSPCMRNVKPGETRTLADIQGAGVIQHLWITVTDHTDKDFFVFRDLVLRMYWDDEEYPSVESPLGDFFCCGFGKPCLVNSQPIVVNPARGMNCFFPMPFKKRARITIENQHEAEIEAFFYQVDYTLYDEMPDDISYFHAQWRREKITELKKDYTILDDVKGKGHYVGTYMALSTLERYWYGEGELKVYLDGDEEYPTICGTGTEDYFGGAWSFAGIKDGVMTEQTYNTPYMGFPYLSRQDDRISSPYYMNDTCTERGFYRWHIPDPILFDEDIRVTIQQLGVCHKGLFERQDDVSSVAYWYQTLPHQKFKPLPPKEERWPR
ncbi:MAG: DUF2961 domain-containing protein [Lachnospiraceae bacterium]|nr:DUF2961 domain-containing protein [Lachnospiraceae bacterium]